MQTLDKLTQSHEVIVKNESTGETLYFDTVKLEHNCSEDGSPFYVLNCKKTGDGCMMFNNFEKQ